MTTTTDYRDALARLRRFIDDPALRQELSNDFQGFCLSPDDIMIEELATIGLRCLEARHLADASPFAWAVFTERKPS